MYNNCILLNYYGKLYRLSTNDRARLLFQQLHRRNQLRERSREIKPSKNRDRSNWTAWSEQMEANLQEELSINLHFRKLKCSKSSNYPRSAIFAVTPFDGHRQNLQTTPTRFLKQLLQFQIFKDIKFKFCTFIPTVCHVHRVQFLQLHHSMANIKIGNCL